MKAVRGEGFTVRFVRTRLPGVARASKLMPSSSAVHDAIMDIPPQEPLEKTSPKPVPPDIAALFKAVAAVAKEAAVQERVHKAKATDPAQALERRLRKAAQDNDCATLRRLVMAGVDLEARDTAGRTALNIATQYNRREAIKTLLAAREMRRLAQLGELPDTVFFRKFRKTG